MSVIAPRRGSSSKRKPLASPVVGYSKVNSTAAGTTAKGHVPSTAQAGDLLVMQMTRSTNTGNPAAPTGWTKISEQGSSVQTIVESTLFYRICDGTEIDADTATFALGASSTWVTRVWAIRLNMNPTTPFLGVVSRFESTGGGSKNLDLSTLSPTGRSVVLYFIVSQSDSGAVTSYSPSASWVTNTHEFVSSTDWYLNFASWINGETGAMGTIDAIQATVTKCVIQACVFNTV